MAPVSPKLRLAAALAALGALATGCGTQGDASILPDKWPLAGLTGYAFRDADEPALLAAPGYDLDEPTALQDLSSGGVVVWGRIAPARMTLPTQLFRARVAALDSPDDTEAVLSATLPWEGAGLRGPSFADPQQPLLFYQGEDGSVGLARLDGDQVTKLSTAAPLVSAALLGGGRKVGRVSAALDPDDDDGTLRLYYTVDDAEVYVAEAAASAVLGGGAVSWQVRPARLVAADFQVPPGDTKAVPAERISELSVRRTVTPAGQVRWDLFLVASADTKSALVAASAYADPNDHEHFAPVASTPLKASSGTLLSPTVTTFHGRPLLLAGLHTVQTVIAAGVLPSSPP